MGLVAVGRALMLANVRIRYPHSMTTSPYAPSQKARIDSVDLLSGLIMVFIMMDHTRDFSQFQAAGVAPTRVAKTTTRLFFSRWVTHFCAPLFVFLAGTGAYFREMRG